MAFDSLKDAQMACWMANESLMDSLMAEKMVYWMAVKMAKH